MPLLNINISHEINAAQSQKIANQLTDLTEKYLHKNPKLTAVSINQTDRHNWFINRESFFAKKDNSFSVRICITEDTNTTAEVESYIEAVYTAMSEILGSVRTESYIIVDHVPALHWGYGGRTQESRKSS